MIAKLNKVFNTQTWIFIESVIVVTLGINVLQSLFWMINQANSFANMIGFIMIPVTLYFIFMYFYYRTWRAFKAFLKSVDTKVKVENDKI